MADLAIKYRPQTFDDVVGNDATVTAIEAILSRESGIPHAWLLHGHSGCGKTTLARIISNELGCDEVEYREYDMGSAGGVDNVRAIIDQVHYSPKVGKVKVYVLDECHMLTTQAQNGLLKILEEPPKHVFFILCTTEPKKLLKTITSRCQAATFEVNKPRKTDVYKLIDRVCQLEGCETLPDTWKAAIYAHGGGCRDVLGMLDKVIDIEDDKEALELLAKSEGLESTVNELCMLMIYNTPTVAKVKPILQSLKEQKEDPESIRRCILVWLTNAALGKGDAKKCAIMLQLFSQPYYDIGFAGLVRDCFDCCQ